LNILSPFKRIYRWFADPDIPPTVNKKNYINVEIDAVGVGLANAASPFLPVFLTRQGASSYEVGLLTTMPAITGLLLVLPLGGFLQSRKKIVPWFSAARLLVILSYALTGLAPFFFTDVNLIRAILVVWALATLPQTVVNLCFSVVMNAVAGPTTRYDLMTRRWSILGATTSLMVIIAGLILDHLPSPVNYQVVFLSLSVGGLISYYYSSHINIPDQHAPLLEQNPGKPLAKLGEFWNLVIKEKRFLTFVSKRFVFMAGITLASPLFPLYFVKEIKASDSWIGAINTATTLLLIIGYFFWSNQYKRNGSRTVLVWTTFGLSLYPLLVSFTHEVWMIVVFAGISGIFQAGLDLVFFDELMKTFPEEYSATFVAIAQGFQFVSAIASPLIGSFLANAIGIGPALIVSSLLRFTGFLLFAMPNKKAPSMSIVEGAPNK